MGGNSLGGEVGKVLLGDGGPGGPISTLQPSPAAIGTTSSATNNSGGAPRGIFNLMLFEKLKK